MQSWLARSMGVVLLAAAPVFGEGAALSVGQPTLENNRYFVPVLMNGGDGQVAALNFRMTYDPAVFRPVAASSGSSAILANKQVTANVPEPGSYIVVLMGLNQETLSPGEVVRVELEALAANVTQSDLQILDPALATYEGNELPARATGRTLDLNEPGEGEKPATPESEEQEPASGETAARLPEDEKAEEGTSAEKEGALLESADTARVPGRGRPLLGAPPQVQGSGRIAKSDTRDFAERAAAASEELGAFRQGLTVTPTEPAAEPGDESISGNSAGRPVSGSAGSPVTGGSLPDLTRTAARNPDTPPEDAQNSPDLSSVNVPQAPPVSAPETAPKSWKKSLILGLTLLLAAGIILFRLNKRPSPS